MTANPDVLLRPATGADVALLEEPRRDPGVAGVFSWWGHSDATAVRRRLDRDGWLGEDDGLLVVVADGTPAGCVTWHAVQHGPGPGSRCWNIGVWLHPDARGRGVGAEAQRKLVEHLFAVTPVRRVEAGTDVDNHAEQRALARAGFQREGVLRLAQYRDGQWRDVALYSRVRD